jgi:hypothetical protein
MNKTSCFLFFIFLLFGANAAWSVPIIQSQSSGAISIPLYSPVGQTFTALDPTLDTVGFKIYDQYGTGSHAPVLFTYTLFQGAGFSGSVLGSASVLLPAGFNGYADASFHSLIVSVGQIYSLMISDPAGNYLVDWNQSADDNGPIAGRIDYTGGVAIDAGVLSPREDLTFHIYVPDSASTALLLGGGFILLLVHKKRTGWGTL